MNEERRRWIDLLLRVCSPPLAAAVGGTLLAECRRRGPERLAPFAPLEAIGRIAVGASAWLGAEGIDADEEAARRPLRDLFLEALSGAVSEDPLRRVDFDSGRQPLVDAAFLAIGLHRGGPALWMALDGRDRHRVLDALERTRCIRPWYNNWVLFRAVIEGFLALAGRPCRRFAIRQGISLFDRWYLGDGVYSDGPSLCVDYYNSFCIHPALRTLSEMDGGTGILLTERTAGRIRARAARFDEIQERSIALDGSFPPLGRSLTYRCAAFHALAHSAWRGTLPDSLAPSAVRGALDAVIRWTLEPPATFDDDGWLSIGLRGAQPGLAEEYISPGSPYLCTTAFLPLGLPAVDRFWSAPTIPRTASLLATGDAVARDGVRLRGRPARARHFWDHYLKRPLAERLLPRRRVSRACRLRATAWAAAMVRSEEHARGCEAT